MKKLRSYLIMKIAFEIFLINALADFNFLSTCNAYSYDCSLNLPVASSNISDGVPFDFLEKAALWKATRKWGDVNLVTSINYCDINKQLIAMHFIFQIGNNNSKTIDEIVIDINNARASYPELYERFLQAKDKENEILKNKRYFVNGSCNGNDNDPQIAVFKHTDEYLKAYDDLENIKNVMSGSSYYGSVLITTRYDMIPIPATLHGLPVFFTKGCRLADVASKKLGSDIKLNHIYMLGPLDQWYEFTNISGRMIIVDAFKEDIYESDDIVNLMADKNYMTADPDIVKAKWKKLENDIIGDLK
ncbi:hypothetical protein JW824_00150 [bacterium]|nr:hypothetical protein [bacterium]